MKQLHMSVSNKTFFESYIFRIKILRFSKVTFSCKSKSKMAYFLFDIVDTIHTFNTSEIRLPMRTFP